MANYVYRGKNSNKTLDMCYAMRILSVLSQMRKRHGLPAISRKSSREQSGHEPKPASGIYPVNANRPDPERAMHITFSNGMPGVEPQIIPFELPPLQAVPAPTGPQSVKEILTALEAIEGVAASTARSTTRRPLIWNSRGFARQSVWRLRAFSRASSISSG